MRLKQGIVIVLAGVLVIALYFVRNKPPQQSPFERLITEAKDSLPPNQLIAIEEAEEDMEDNQGDVEQLRQLEGAWEATGNEAISALFAYRIAKKERSPEAWKHAGHQLTEGFRYGREERLSPNLIHFFSVKATESFQKALDVNEEDIEALIGLAVAFTDGEQEIMKGVQMLLKVIEQDPDNIKANQILGRYSMVSGQYEKAVDRLETVLKQDPKNVEALFYLGEAHFGLEQNEQALAKYEQAQSLAESPAILNQIDQRIKEIKK